MRYSDETPQASWQGEEVEVSFTGKPVKSDYGVPGSPTFTVMEDIEIDEVKILGVEVDPKELPQALRDRIERLADELDW